MQALTIASAEAPRQSPLRGVLQSRRLSQGGRIAIRGDGPRAGALTT